MPMDRIEYALFILKAVSGSFEFIEQHEQGFEGGVIDKHKCANGYA